MFYFDHKLNELLLETSFFFAAVVVVLLSLYVCTYVAPLSLMFGCVTIVSVTQRVCELAHAHNTHAHIGVFGLVSLSSVKRYC